MHPIAQTLQKVFKSAGNKQIALKQSAYMRDQFPFFGIQKPDAQKLCRAIFKEHPITCEDELIACVHQLWCLPERDFQYAAYELLVFHQKRWSQKLLPEIECLIITKSWWDTVDALAPNVVGLLFQKYPELVKVVDTWVMSDNMWLRRSALIYQLRYKQKTDAMRLFKHADMLAHEKEFFIRKAIGWALREYAKIDQDAVRTYIILRKEKLSPLSFREAAKHLTII